VEGEEVPGPPLVIALKLGAPGKEQLCGFVGARSVKGVDGMTVHVGILYDADSGPK
jgi:hypothetical protein